jgi:LuxR family maltose regulon positive regulatory protein
MAAREELRRPVVLAGPSIQRLVGADPRLRSEYAWVGKPGLVSSTSTLPDQRRSPDAGPMASGMIEELTAKEGEVLGHLADLLSTDEIAEQMFVSVNTVRTHVRSILRKLGVNRRNAAVRKARELGILAA